MLYYKYYKNPNSDEDVVLLHGLGGSSLIWYKQLRFLKESFNVLLVDLHSHGGSKEHKLSLLKNQTFDKIAEDVVEVMNYLNIEKAHFFGISLGTVIIRGIERLFPEKIKSMVLGGAVTRINPFSSSFLKAGNMVKNMFSYMWLYELFAKIIMPFKRHADSRKVFIKEATKLGREEFCCWFTLISKLNKYNKILYKNIKNIDLSIPRLYIMGSEDYIFLHGVKKLIKKEKSELAIIDKCGHICNIEKPKDFNEISYNFLKSIV